MLTHAPLARQARWKIALALPLLAITLAFYACQRDTNSVTVMGKNGSMTGRIVNLSNVGVAGAAIFADDVILTVTDQAGRYRLNIPSDTSRVYACLGCETNGKTLSKAMIIGKIIPIGVGKELKADALTGEKVTQVTRDPTQNTRIDGGLIYTVVESMPEYPGGTDGLFAYLAAKTKYPEEALKAKQQGRVFLSFIVDAKGKVRDPQITKSAGDALDTEALRLVRNMPDWKPGTQNGKPVAVRYTLPIAFTL